MTSKDKEDSIAVYFESMKVSVTAFGALGWVVEEDVPPTHEVKLVITCTQLEEFRQNDFWVEALKGLGHDFLTETFKKKGLPKYPILAGKDEHHFWCLMTHDGREHPDLDDISLLKALKDTPDGQIRLDLVHKDKDDGLQALTDGLLASCVGKACIYVREVKVLAKVAA